MPDPAPQALTYLTGRPIDIPQDAHVLLSVVKDEALRLPYFLSYHRELGFDRFILVDNGSTDGTRELLRKSPDTFVFHTTARFGVGPGAGLEWKKHLLDRFCDGRWVLVADADELLVWPGSENAKVQELSGRMAEEGASVLFTLMIDMYSEKPFGQIGYVPGAPFIEYAPYFHRKPYLLMSAQPFPGHQVYGGVRSRIFELYADRIYQPKLGREMPLPPPTISKVPFLRWQRGQSFIAAQHALSVPAPLARMRGGLLHFKMLDDLPARCAAKERTAEYFQEGLEHRILGRAIERREGGNFFEPEFSVRYRDTRQLKEMGLMDDGDAFAGLPRPSP